MSSTNRHRYSAHQNLRATRFICHSTQAESVCLVGDFNRWDSAKHPMEQMVDGSWFISVELRHGHHRYAYLVDGTLTLDPHAMGVTQSDQGQRVSLVAVS